MKRNRKTVSFVLFAALLLSIIVFPAFVRGNKAIAESTTTTGSTGASPIDSAEFVIGMNQYFVNNQAPGISMDAAPYIDSGRTLVPVRYLADALGATTNWDSDTQQVTVSTAAYNISMTIGSTTLTVNGQAQTMDVAPVINDGRTYLPARWVANASGVSGGLELPIPDRDHLAEWYSGAGLRQRDHPGAAETDRGEWVYYSGGNEFDC